MNLAASAIKLLEYEASKDLCSLVLSSFPHTVKALFRRVVAYMGLKMFVEAKTDLERTLLVEPKNKDIIRELSEVNNYLIINCNGKRKLEEGSEGENTHTLDMESNKKSLVEHGECSSSNFSSELRLDGNDSTLTYGISECPNMELDPKVETQHEGEKMSHFGKKGDGRSNLRISASTYQKLLDGNEVSFYQNHHPTIMRIRIHKPCNIEVKKQPDAPHKKKRKRRPKKKKTKAKDTNTTNEALDPSILSSNDAYERKTIEKKTNIDVSAKSVEISMVEDNISIVEAEVHEIRDTHLPARNLAATTKRTFKRLPNSRQDCTYINMDLNLLMLTLQMFYA